MSRSRLEIILFLIYTNQGRLRNVQPGKTPNFFRLPLLLYFLMILQQQRFPEKWREQNGFYDHYKWAYFTNISIVLRHCARESYNSLYYLIYLLSYQKRQGHQENLDWAMEHKALLYDDDILLYFIDTTQNTCILLKSLS